MKISSYEKEKIIKLKFGWTGFDQTNIGCCGTGLVEAGPLCNKITPTCEDPSKFMFWDSIHPSEATYKFVTESLLKQFFDRLNWIGSSEGFWAQFLPLKA